MAIYLDNAATTQISDEVLDVLYKVQKENYGNPSSIYKIGREAKTLIEDAREICAKQLNADSNEIFFTGSGTESDNFAIKGILEANKAKGNHVITSKIEHHAVLHTLEYLEKKGEITVTYLDVDSEGLVSVEDVKNAITDKTVLITIMFANNEIGTIMPIKEIGAIAKEKGIVFHTDAVQAGGHIPIDVKEMNIDLLSMSAHKIHGPKGVGLIYIRKGVKIRPLLLGGGQERKRRPSTENVAGIVAFAKAFELAVTHMEEDNKKMTALRERLINGILTTIPHTSLNGHKEKRLPNNVNITFNFIEGEMLLLSLDMVGIYASSGSACTSGSLDPSHVIMALGVKHEHAHGSLRLSLSKYTTEEEVDFTIEQLKPIVERLRAMSPLYEDFLNGLI